MKEQKFAVVSDELRNLPRGTGGAPPNPINVAMLGGQTVWVPLNGKGATYIANRHNQPLSRKGYRIHYRRYDKDGEPGVVMWCVRKEDAS